MGPDAIPDANQKPLSRNGSIRGSPSIGSTSTRATSAVYLPDPLHDPSLPERSTSPDTGYSSHGSAGVSQCATPGDASVPQHFRSCSPACSATTWP